MAAALRQGVLQRDMHAASGAAGVARRHQRLFQPWLQQPHQRMVRHAVGERGGVDEARLGVADGELAQAAIRQAGIKHGPPDYLQSLRRCVEEGHHIRALALATGSGPQRGFQVRPRGHVGQLDADGAGHGVAAGGAGSISVATTSRITARTDSP